MKKEKDKIKVFVTNDMGLCATLSAMGFHIVKSELEDGVVQFYFQQDEGIKEMSQDYYMGSALINARVLVNELKSIRKIIGAHLNYKNARALQEKEIEHPYEDQETTKKRKKGEDPEFIIGNNGFKRI